MALTNEDLLSLYNLYALATRLISEGDVEGWVDLFTEDAEFIIPPIERLDSPGFTMKGPQDLRQFITQHLDGTFDRQLGLPEGTKKRYLTSNILLEESSDGGVEGSAYSTILLLHNGTTNFFGTGVYKDHFVRGTEGWKIARRHLTPDA